MFEYWALICGGIGPDNWDKEIIFTAENFMDAAELAQGRADEMGGQIVQLQQVE